MAEAVVGAVVAVVAEEAGCCYWEEMNMFSQSMLFLQDKLKGTSNFC